MKRVEIYTKSWCPFCQRAKALLNTLEVIFDEVDVEDEPARLKEMLERADGVRTVPQIFINGQHIGGSDDLHALHYAGELRALLEARTTA
ncbi:MAG: glutaredoxin 3 [Pseudomonadota bacterium]